MFEARKEEEREGGRKSWRREGERKTLKEGRREREGGRRKSEGAIFWMMVEEEKRQAM